MKRPTKRQAEALERALRDRRESRKPGGAIRVVRRRRCRMGLRRISPWSEERQR